MRSLSSIERETEESARRAVARELFARKEGGRVKKEGPLLLRLSFVVALGWTLLLPPWDAFMSPRKVYCSLAGYCLWVSLWVCLV